MNKAIKRILTLALALVLALGALPSSAPTMTLTTYAAQPDYAKDMAVGTWTGAGRRTIAFGEHNGSPILWRVLEVYTSDGTADNNNGNKTALLLAEDCVDTLLFGSSGDGNWINSEIKTWLNGNFFDTAFDEDEQSAIVTSTYKLGGNYFYSGYGYDTDDDSQVFLLSVDEATDSEYFEDGANSGRNVDRDAGAEWWLRSPGYNDNYVAVVQSGGAVYADGAPWFSDNGIRPALKVNLASDIFTSSEILYSPEITVRDGQGNRIAGVHISLSGASAPDASFFTDDGGSGHFSERFPAGEYALTVTKAGYPTYTGTITVGENSIKHAVTLSEAGVPATVRFGRYSGNAVNWRVLNIAGGKALLLCEDGLKADNWAAVDSWINNSSTGGFLENFSQGELDAMEDHSGSTGNPFLLSSQEATDYLPTNALRIFSHAINSERYWWLRDNDGSHPYTVNFTGEIAIRNATQSYDARPAVWLDLSKLCQVIDSGITTFVPAFAATVNVEDGGNTPVAGVSLTLAPTSGSDAIRGGDGSDILSGVTAGSGEADFALPEGTYDISVSGVSGLTGSGVLTVSSGGANAVTITLSPNAAPTQSPGDLTRTMGKDGSASFDADDIATDTDVGDTLTITAIHTHPDSAVATASLDNGTVTVSAVDYGSASVAVTVTDGGSDVTIPVPIKVTDEPFVSTASLTVTAGDAADFDVSLGNGPDAADSASITSSNTAVATATPASLTLGQSGTITVTGQSAGGATLSIGYSGGGRDGEIDTVQVTVKPKIVQVDFDPQGGTPQPAPITVDTQGTYPALPAVIRGGHTFDGWFTAASGGSKISEGDAVTNGSDHTLYAHWAQPAPSPSSSRNRDSGGSSRQDTARAATQTGPHWLTDAEIKAAADRANQNGDDYARFRRGGSYGVRAAQWELFGDLSLRADTTGSPVQVRVSIPEPSKLTADLLLSGAVKGSTVDSRNAFFEKWFSNQLRVIHFDHSGEWGQPVEIAAKVDLTDMDTTNLYFYSYDKASNSYKRIENPGAWVDKNGYLHFTTELAGSVIISEGVLERK